ncbi:MAG: putative DNA binding domain-containing protein [Bacteroidales bacterium]|nr:putative DNA binding domain-containing protein [Bacteroidales bacterium]
MTLDKLEDILKKGEGIEVEFKTALFELSKNTFESICAFLNRSGGHLLLGVKNDGTVEGVMEERVQDIVNNIITNANNPQKLNPPFYLSAQVIDYYERKVIYLFVPESSQVHRTNSKIFDRNEDGDFDITDQNELITQLYLRKQSTYSENRIYPYLKLSDFKHELFSRVRIMVKNERADHPWQDMTDEELLRSAGLFKQDHQSGKKGFTLAAVLLLGKDEIIQSVLPHHKTDAILRIENTDRYDDRDDIRTNLIESYDRLMSFVRKHLPDKFYQEGDQRISLRDRIFREIVGNLLIHREFSNAYPAKLIIEGARVITENWNRPHGNGLIDPSNFTPYPKNPVIAKFFKEIGRVDELGSGVRNTFKYCDIYSPGTRPEFVEEDVFRTIIPLKAIDGTIHSPSSDWEKARSIVLNKFGKLFYKEAWNEVDYGRITEELRKKYGRNAEEIVTWIHLNPEITMGELAIKIKRSQSTVEKNIKTLREAGIIIRVGSTKAGLWKTNI